MKKRRSREVERSITYLCRRTCAVPDRREIFLSELFLAFELCEFGPFGKDLIFARLHRHSRASLGAGCQVAEQVFLIVL